MTSYLGSLKGKVALVTGASRGIGRAAAVALLGLLMLPIACRAEPPVGTPVALGAHAETTSDGSVASPEPDWPQWNGSRRDGFSREAGLLAAWPVAGPTLIWKIGNLGRGWSSPIRLCLRYHETLWCYDVRSHDNRDQRR